IFSITSADFPFLDVHSSDFFEAAESARANARNLIVQSQRSQADYYNASHRDYCFRVNDLVWLYVPTRLPGLAEKLLRRFYGPYQIIRVLSPVTYQISTIPVSSSSSRQDTVHISRLKPYHSR